MLGEYVYDCMFPFAMEAGQRGRARNLVHSPQAVRLYDGSTASSQTARQRCGTTISGCMRTCSPKLSGASSTTLVSGV